MACLNVIGAYAQDDFELRRRTEEISLHLSRLSASNTKKMRGLAAIDDMLFGPCFDERGERSSPSKGGGHSWSNVDGLEAFRRILVVDDAENSDKGDDQEFGKRIPLSSKLGIALRSL